MSNESMFPPLNGTQSEAAAPQAESTPFSPLTLERAKQLAAELVAEFGEGYVYEPAGPADVGFCKYVHGDVPGCIVGHMLHRHGVPLSDLRDFDYNGGGSLAKGSVISNAPDGWFTEEALPFLATLQYEQDMDRCWGEALARANGAGD
ncbi:hypothetical protein [Lentzea sp. NBRC 102530]|uniref:hypothetical protein n=1 Tax=Lentzea sp. NBRC 102530 TaxID=3032201 RepID=UPI0024A4F0AC|nr:hypothetical protein [Lentzea sp. NBRC 102530]GLY55310.1 hypothetical protein Lesp01_89650 [Lentzea sp. NBRC 102530]